MPLTEVSFTDAVLCALFGAGLFALFSELLRRMHRADKKQVDATTSSTQSTNVDTDDDTDDDDMTQHTSTTHKSVVKRLSVYVPLKQ